ncbi:hypothetical protein BC830DRAFT_1148414 [Chytriomyces sp. MP71]|nr:hypothetical protein BC830DRAFT_1148414 [Chytriomyces sp. MP71]
MTFMPLQQITPDRVGEAICFIALHNSNHRCMLVDDNEAGIRSDFFNFDIEPTRDIYFTSSKDDSSITGLVGLLVEDGKAMVVGPWASEASGLQGLMAGITDVARSRGGILSLKSGMVGAIANPVFEGAGFTFLRNDLDMQLRKATLPVVKSNPDAFCSLLRPYPDDLESHKQVQRIHAALFKSRDYNPDNWADKFTSEYLNWVFACQLDGNLVGYSLCMRQQDSVYLVNIGTDEKFQNKRIASSLLLFIRKWFIESGFRDLTLNVHTVKEHAVKLYMDVGFEVKTTAFCWEKMLD